MEVWQAHAQFRCVTHFGNNFQQIQFVFGVPLISVFLPSLLLSLSVEIRKVAKNAIQGNRTSACAIFRVVHGTRGRQSDSGEGSEGISGHVWDKA